MNIKALVISYDQLFCILRHGNLPPGLLNTAARADRQVTSPSAGKRVSQGCVEL